MSYRSPDLTHPAGCVRHDPDAAIYPKETQVNRSLRSWTATLFVGLAAGAAVLIVSSPASAAPGSISCVGTTQITYDPGITFTPRTVQATETNHFSPCTSTEAGITAGANVLEYPADWSCLTPLHSGPAAYPVHWNNGTSSTLSINFTVTSGGGQVISTVHGTVTDGVLAGATVTGTWTFLQPELTQCLTEGITEQIGTVTLTLAKTA